MGRFRVAVSVLAATWGISTGCASVQPLDASRVAPAGRIITQEMISSYSVANAWEVLRKVGAYRTSRDDGPSSPPGIRSSRGRSSLLLANADVPKIILDGARITDFRVLRDVAASSIAWIQLLNGMDGTLYEGTNSGAGVILIVTRAGI